MAPTPMTTNNNNNNKIIIRTSTKTLFYFRKFTSIFEQESNEIQYKEYSGESGLGEK